MSALPEQIIHFFNFIGSLVCHQDSKKTLIIGEQLVPVCARCTGAYLGFLVGYVVILFRKKKANGPPNLWVTLVLSIPMIVDVATQVLGVRESMPSLRLLTGLFFGTALLPFLIYLLQLAPIMQHLPVFSMISPQKPQVNDVKNPWIPFRASLLGVLVCLGTFFLVGYATTSSNPLLYWIITLPTILSIFIHIFYLPVLVLGSLVYEFFRFYILDRRR
jgi:uncharacterized membrane protein